MSVGSNIRMLREQRHMTQQSLARAAVCSVQTVSAWEKDKKTPRMGALKVLASLFGVPVSAILDIDEQEVSRLCLSEDERAMLEMFRRVRAQNRPIVLSMIEAALKTQGLDV